MSITAILGKGLKLFRNLHSFTGDARNWMCSNLPNSHNTFMLLLQNKFLQRHLASFFSQRVPVSAQKKAEVMTQCSVKCERSCNKPNAPKLVCKHSEVNTIQIQKYIGNSWWYTFSTYRFWNLVLLGLEHPVLSGNRALERRQTDCNMN